MTELHTTHPKIFTIIQNYRHPTMVFIFRIFGIVCRGETHIFHCRLRNSARPGLHLNESLFGSHGTSERRIQKQRISGNSQNLTFPMNFHIAGAFFITHFPTNIGRFSAEIVHIHLIDPFFGSPTRNHNRLIHLVFIRIRHTNEHITHFHRFTGSLLGCPHTIQTTAYANQSGSVLARAQQFRTIFAGTATAQHHTGSRNLQASIYLKLTSIQLHGTTKTGCIHRQGRYIIDSRLNIRCCITLDMRHKSLHIHPWNLLVRSLVSTI